MATILLSIKPEYSKRIFDGTKKFEFRKHLAQYKVTRIVVYSTFPEMAVIGEVEVIDTLSMKPTPLWELTKKTAGISRKKYREYFRSCDKACAYKLGKTTSYKTPKKLSDYGIKQAPQSFVYLRECPFCREVILSPLSEANNAKSEEHILPLSLGNEDLIIPKGLICDKCNNYFAREIEKPFLNNDAIRLLRSYHTVPSRKKKVPPIEAYINNEIAQIEIDPKNNCSFISLSPETIEKICSGDISCFITRSVDPASLVGNYHVSRFLVKVFLEMCLLYQFEYNKDKIYHTFFVFDETMDDLLSYVRFGNRNKKVYSYSVSQVENTKPFQDDGFVASVDMLWDDEKQLMGMRLQLYELEFKLEVSARQ